MVVEEQSQVNAIRNDHQGHIRMQECTKRKRGFRKHNENTARKQKPHATKIRRSQNLGIATSSRKSLLYTVATVAR